MTETGNEPKSVVLLGATSPIARASGWAFGRDGYDVVTGARDGDENERIAQDIAVRYGVNAYAEPFDALDFDSHPDYVAACEQHLGALPTGVVLYFGYMAEQAVAQDDFEAARRTIDVNLTAAISILEQFARRFEERGGGFMGIVSSVAGDRGRKSNYIYGAAKAGLSTYAQGLRNRLFGAGVTVTTIKPGFVDTPMTYGLPLPGPLVASPETAGEAIYRAVAAGKHVAYVPFFWRYIMLIIRSIPEWQFKKMNI